MMKPKPERSSLGIGRSKGLPNADRRRLLDQVEYVSEQAVKGALERRPGMIAAALAALDASAKATVSISAIWAGVHPLLKAFFGIA
jgi:hypothetical protein